MSSKAFSRWPAVPLNRSPSTKRRGRTQRRITSFPPPLLDPSPHSVYKKASNTSRGTQGNSWNIFRWRRACLCRTPPNQSRGAFAAAGRTVKPIVCLQKWAKIKVRSDRTSDPRLMTQNSNRWHREISKNVILLLLPLAETTTINLLSQRGGDSRLRKQINRRHLISFKAPRRAPKLFFSCLIFPLHFPSRSSLHPLLSIPTLSKARGYQIAQSQKPAALTAGKQFLPTKPCLHSSGSFIHNPLWGERRKSC